MDDIIRLRLGGLALLAALALAGTSTADEPRWYRIELAGGERITARYLGEDAECWVVSFQGSPLRLPKSGVRSMEPSASESAQNSPPAAVPRPAASRGETTAQRDPPAGPATTSSTGAVLPLDPAAEEAIRDSIEVLASTQEADVNRAFRSLGDALPAARPILHASLDHRSAEVRMRLIKLLGERGDAKEDLKAVAGRLRDDKSTVRLAAVMALKEFGPDALQELVSYLGTETQFNNRKMAVKAISKWRDKRALEPLVQRLRSEPDESVRFWVVIALENLTRLKLGSEPEAWEAYLVEMRRQEQMERLAREAPDGAGTPKTGSTSEKE